MEYRQRYKPKVRDPTWGEVLGVVADELRWTLAAAPGAALEDRTWSNRRTHVLRVTEKSSSIDALLGNKFFLLPGSSVRRRACGAAKPAVQFLHAAAAAAGGGAADRGFLAPVVVVLNLDRQPADRKVYLADVVLMQVRV
jgi:hypothetical protein